MKVHTAEVMWMTDSRLRGQVPTSRVHQWGGDIRASTRVTLCKVRLPKRSQWITPTDSDPRCKRCQAATPTFASSKKEGSP